MCGKRWVSLCCQPVAALVQPSSSLRPSPLSKPLSSCVLMAHNVTHMPQSRVESRQPCLSHSQTKVWQTFVIYYVGVRQPESYTIYNILLDNWTEGQPAAGRGCFLYPERWHLKNAWKQRNCPVALWGKKREIERELRVKLDLKLRC